MAPASASPHVVVPLAPAAPQLEAGPGTLEVSWEPPAARIGGTLAACWMLRYSGDGGRSWVTVPHHTTTPSATLEGLSPGQSYLVRVAALLGGLTGFWSPTTEATPTGPVEDAHEPDTPEAPEAPGHPEDLALTPGPGSVTVSWEPPSDTGGAPLLGYAVEYGTDGIVYHRWTQPDSLTTDTTVTIGGLTGDQEHHVRVGAVGCAGVSLWTPAAKATPTVVPPTAPGAPDTPTITPGAGELTVTWTAPEDDGGAPITGYLIEYSTDGGETWVPWPHTTTATTTVIGGLTGGRDHQVRVTATNTAGGGEPSPTATAAPTSAPPDRPATPTITPGPGTLTVTWTAPHNNGAPITGYLIEYSTDQGHSWVPWPHTTTATTTTIGDLTSGHHHQVRISATNTAGTSRPSPPTRATPH